MIKNEKNIVICSGCLDNVNKKDINIIEITSEDMNYKTFFCDNCCTKNNYKIEKKLTIKSSKVKKS